MSVWTTKSQGKDRDYILLKHNLPNMNYQIGGVKFRGSYAVVEKNSKTYHNLLKISVLKGAKEYPITFLRKLPFITRTSDIKIIYGQDVYKHYLDAYLEQKKQEHLTSNTKCKSKTKTGELCNLELLPESPSGYCGMHILSDPKLPELGIEVPQYMTKTERREFQDKLIRKLGRMKKSNNDKNEEK